MSQSVSRSSLTELMLNQGAKIRSRDQKVYVHLIRKFLNDIKTKVSGCFWLIAEKIRKKVMAG